MTSFVDSWEYERLLDISKEHLHALDRSRVLESSILGIDNHNTLMVSTVFAAIAIEAAINDYILIHCLFLDRPYLQAVFGDITDSYLRSSVQKRINFVRDHWTEEFPDPLLNDVRKLFQIRNKIMHQSRKYITASKSEDGEAKVTNRSLTNDEMQHMLRHYDIAREFLSRFDLPGTRELERGRQPTGHDSAPTVPDAGYG